MKWIAEITNFNFANLNNFFESRNQKCSSDGPLKKKSSELFGNFKGGSQHILR